MENCLVMAQQAKFGGNCPPVQSLSGVKEGSDGWYLPGYILAYLADPDDPRSRESIRIVGCPEHAEGECQLNLSATKDELLVEMTEQYWATHDPEELEFWPNYEIGYELDEVLRMLYRNLEDPIPPEVSVSLICRYSKLSTIITYFEFDVIRIVLEPEVEVEDEDGEELDS